MRTTYLGEVVAIREAQYTNYVFRNLDEANNSLLRYVTVTRLPNWDCKKLNIGDIGYFECDYVNAGESYIKASTGNAETYKYTICYLINFIEKQQINNNNIYDF